MNAKDLELLIYNPFHLSKILHHFLSGVLSLDDKGVKSELIYLVIPFVLDEKVCYKLQNLNINSRLNVIIENKSYEVFMSQLNEIILYTKKKTKHSLILLASATNMTFDDYIKIEEKISFKKEDDKILKDIYKASYNLGMLIAKEDCIIIMKKLRINQL
ncbi:MAG: hypothetical protein H6Q15_1467 [Bacteroidetes bacterium]|nr:hypothetical protein [Bacteroidota bacterium]